MTKLVTPVGEMQRSAAKSMGRLADKVKTDHQGMLTHRHIRDAARVLLRGNTDGAKRHLDAAVHEMQPMTLYRHGLLTDEHHSLAKQNMGEIHRHRLLVADIEDVRARNQENIARLRSEAAGTSIPSAPEPSSSVNAPSKTPVGRIDINVASGPAEPPPTTSQNHSITMQAALELAAWEHERRGAGGKWASSGSADDKFTYAGGAGSFSHARAIRDLAEKIAPRGDLRIRVTETEDTDTLRNALNNAARALVQRNMPEVQAHFDMAMGAAQRIGPQATKLVQGARDSLKDVPAGSRSMRSEPRDRGPRQGLKYMTPAMGVALSWQDELRNRQGEWTGMSEEAIQGVGKRHGADVAAHLRAFKTADSKDVAISHLDSAYEKISTNMRNDRSPTAQGAINRQRDVGLLNTLNTMRKQANAIEMSAQTARLAVTPAPRGKPGGPGLYDVKGLGHTPYLQQVVKALIEKRGMEPGKAYAIARASIRRWMAKSKHPEVKAAATAAESGELAKQAQAHAHASQIQDFREIWELACQMATAIELTGTAAGAAKDQRVAKGQVGGGRFGKGGGQPQGKGKPGKGHPHHQNRAQQKAQLRAKIAGERLQLRGLLGQLRNLNLGSYQINRTGTAARAGTAAASTAAAAATPAAAAAAVARATAARAPSNTPRKVSASHAARRAALRSRINALRAEIRQQERQLARM